MTFVTNKTIHWGKEVHLKHCCLIRKWPVIGSILIPTYPFRLVGPLFKCKGKKTKCTVKPRCLVQCFATHQKERFFVSFRNCPWLFQMCVFFSGQLVAKVISVNRQMLFFVKDEKRKLKIGNFSKQFIKQIRLRQRQIFVSRRLKKK